MSAPKLRFKEFAGGWKSFSLLDLSSDKTLNNGVFNDQNKVGKGYKLINVLDMYIDRDIDESRLSLLDLSKQEFERNKVKYGDIFFTRSSLVKEGIAYSNVYLGSSNDITYDGHLIKLSPNLEQINSIFLNYGLKTSKVRKQLIQGGKTATMTTIGQKEIASTKIDVPFLQEQTKIASFLSAVDEKISQLTQKHQLLSQYKQGMMHKLFNQQIRFKADDGSEFGEWEDKTISDIASYRRGSFPQPYGLPEWLDENGFPFVQVYDVAENMLLKDKTKIKISQLAANQSVLAKAGTLIITLQGSIGRVAKMQYDAYVDRTLLIFQSYAMPIDTDYFKYALYLLFNIEKEKADGGIIKTITKETLSKFNIGIPCLEEQTKIANFLSAIDQKIDVASEQLEQAKLWKKGLLQQMFV